MKVTRNGKEALLKARKESFNLVLTDLRMPRMNGIQLLKELTRIAPDMKVIVMSATADLETSVEMRKFKAHDYITKPFKSSELRSRINVGRRIIELQASLIEKEKLQGIIEMAGAVCHELNQPLQVVSGISELLTMDIQENNPLYEKMTLLEEQIKRMGEITLKLAKITSYETMKYLEGKIVDIDRSSKEDI